LFLYGKDKGRKSPVGRLLSLGRVASDDGQAARQPQAIQARAKQPSPFICLSAPISHRHGVGDAVALLLLLYFGVVAAAADTDTDDNDESDESENYDDDEIGTGRRLFFFRRRCLRRRSRQRL